MPRAAAADHAILNARHYLLVELLHRAHGALRLAPDRGYQPRDAHLGEGLHLRYRQRPAQARAERDFQRAGAVLRALMAAQTRDEVAGVGDVLRDPIPSVGHLGGAAQRGLSMAAKDHRRAWLLNRLGHKLAPRDADRAPLEDRVVAGPQLAHQGKVLARAPRAVAEGHPDC